MSFGQKIYSLTSKKLPENGIISSAKIYSSYQLLVIRYSKENLIVFYIPTLGEMPYSVAISLNQ